MTVEIDQPELTDHAHFVRRAADALMAGHMEAAQALSADLVDTIICQGSSPGEIRRKIELIRRRRRRATGLCCPGFGAPTGGIAANRGDPIPTMFSRHASVHAVSMRQYGRANAVIALMHATALVTLVDELSR